MPSIPRSPSGEMPFLDHLEELRWRIIYSLGALVIGVGIGFSLAFKLDLIVWLQRPMLPYLRGHKLVYTHPGDTFSIILQMSLVVGIVLALPVIGYKVWAFLSPALYRHERRVVDPGASRGDAAVRRRRRARVLPRPAADAQVPLRPRGAVVDADDHGVASTSAS